MSFFGNPNNAGAGGNTFAGTNASIPATGGASGGAGTNPPQPGNLFGNTNSGGGIFGGGSAAPSTNQPGGGLFGGGSSTAPSGGLFGGGTNAASSTAPSVGGGLFGAPKPAGTTGGIFGSGATTTPAASGTSGGLFGGGAPAAPATGGLFGAPPPTAGSNASNSTPNTLFGGGFSLLKPGDASTVKGPTAGFFSQPPSTGTTPGTNAAPPTGGGLFGLPAKPAQLNTTTPTGGAPGSNPTVTTAPAAGSSLFGGGLFGVKPPTAPSTTTATTGFSLGAEKKDTPAPTATNGGGLFGAPTAKKEEPKKDTPTAAPAFNLFGGQKTEEKKDTGNSTTALTVTKDGDRRDAPGTSGAVAVPPPSMLRGKTLEEIVNRWTTDLETNVREFNKFAAEVAVWDRALIENGNNIAALYSHVLAAEKQQNDINEALNHIEQQQKDLGSTLDAYEKVSQEILGNQGSSLRSLDSGPADNERDKNYMLATDLHTHLDDLSGSLTQMIESVNGLSIASRPEDSANEPMSQITQILSSHLESLQWIDTAVREVESKASDVERRIKDSGHNLSSTGSKSRGFGR
ncbi:Nsp1-like C-terminal region-domain-containing protein [Crepidotus variabilis]|uniref:Nucleoporin NSP1 n=1 Tax=Crepidotus variabilis TaxID=179855 RepID=A0A9P6ES62_9AGAR|nr:Nsp1-like C-terminal region-domain-containing protein [Crepidotus variabilis]